MQSNNTEKNPEKYLNLSTQGSKLFFFQLLTIEKCIYRRHRFFSGKKDADEKVFVIRTCTTETNESYFNAVIMHLYIQIDNIQINVTTLREFSGDRDATRRDMVVWTNFNVIRSIRHLFVEKEREKKQCAATVEQYKLSVCEICTF